MVSPHRIVVALVGEAPLRTEGSTSRRLQSDFFVLCRLSGRSTLILLPMLLNELEVRTVTRSSIISPF
jgi:hypothetical protein